MTDLSSRADALTDAVLATMTDEQIANMSEAEMVALATGVALIVVPER